MKNKARHIIFIVLALLIVSVSAIAALQGDETWTSDVYGSTNNGAIRVENGQEIRADFVMQRDSFQGVYLRFVSTTQTFGSETLECCLQDAQTGEVLAQYSLPLKNILSQIDVFVKLPCENAKGRQVSLILTGKNINKCPMLFVSKIKNSGLPSQLYYNNRLYKTRALSFSAAYVETSGINLNALIKGGVYLFLLLLVYLWPGLFGKADRNVKIVSGKNTGQSRLTGLIKNGRKTVFFAGFSFIFFVMAVFVFNNNIEEKISEKTTAVICETAAGGTDQGNIVLQSDDDCFEQTFYVTQDMLSALLYEAAVENPHPDAGLHIEIYNRFKTVCYHDEHVRTTSLPTDRREWKISLSKPVMLFRTEEESDEEDSEEEDIDTGLLVRITPEGFRDTTVTLYAGSPVDTTSVRVNSVLTGAVPALQIVYYDYDFLKELFWLFVILVYGFFILFYLLLVVKKVSVQRAFIPLVMYLGLLYLLVIPVYSVPDEYAHADTAYSISNRMLGIKKPENMAGYDYKRQCDIETEEYLTYYTTPDDYRRIYREITKPAGNTDLEMCVVRSTASNVNVLYFIPAAVGITIARLLGLGTLQMLLLGRLMNFMVFVFLSFLAIRKLPLMKEEFMLFVTLPIVLQQAASYSYDSILNAVAFVFIAYSLHFCFTRDEIRMADSLILFFTLIQIVSVKGGCYLPLALLMFLIPLERNWKWKTIAGYVCTMGVCLFAAFAQGSFAGVLKNYFINTSANVNSFTGMQLYTAGYLVSHPAKAVSLFANTVFIHGSRLVYEFFSGKMGSLGNMQLPWFYVIVFMFVLVSFSFRYSGNVRFRSRYSRVILCLACVMLAGLIFLSMLLADTSTKYDSIRGLQGRYFIPGGFLLFLLPAAFGKQKSAARNKYVKYSLLFYTVQVISILNLIMLVLPNE